MKLLLDENLPQQLLKEFPDHKVFTIQNQGWKGKTNGELLQLMLESKFDVLIKADKNLQHQQNFIKYPIPVIVISVFRLNFNRIKPLLAKINSLLNSSLLPGPVIIE